MDNGFNRACPSGNIMIDGYNEGKSCVCGRCDGNGTYEWDDMEEYIEELGHRIYRLKKIGHEPKSFLSLLKLARSLKIQGKECDLCDGTGRVEE